MKKRNQPKVEQVEMNEVATKASRVAESRTACLIDESLRIARLNNQDPFRTLAVSAYLQGVQDALTPPTDKETHAHCRGGRDGDCFWKDCPQLRDGEPVKTGRHCPLDVPIYEEE